MTDKNIRLLELISKGCPNDEICKELNISRNQLKRRVESIKYEGYNIVTRYNYNGTSRYFLDKRPKDDANSFPIYTSNKKEFKMIAIADTHFGFKKSKLEYSHLLYDYCEKKGLNIIVHCGDILQGSFQSEYSCEEQLEQFLKDFPHSNNILMFTAFGNHEEEIVHKGLNVSRIIEKERDDIIPLGYGMSKLKVYSNNILVSHKRNFKEEYGLKLAGHSHRYKFVTSPTGPIIVVPTLSDHLHTTDYPGAVELKISLDGNKNFNKLEVTHLTIDKRGKGNYRFNEASTVETSFQRTR